jgi:hypothetical protein
MERSSNPRRRRGRKSRRRNPWDRDAAVALGVVGGVLGIASAFAAASTDRVWTRAVVAGATGGAAGAVLGALLPKGKSSNPLQNPIGTATAVIAGTALALVPVAVAAKVMLPKSAGRSAAPTVRGKMGAHAIDVYRNGPTWAWRAPDVKISSTSNESMAGAGDTRRDAIVNAYSDLVIKDLGPDDRITLDFYPESFQIQVLSSNGSWTWNTTTGEGGVADSRGDALTKALDWVDAHSELD